MTREQFEQFLKANEYVIDDICMEAWKLHETVGQWYDKSLPYGHHLSMVADAAMKYGHHVLTDEQDIISVIFGAFFHDSIEDARQSYNDVRRIAEKYMTPDKAVMAAEIVYALTNEKGRTRQERAGERYYAGIRETPYAPFVKLCDRFANMTFSSTGKNQHNHHMHMVYASEWPHFIESITADSTDIRMQLPQTMLEDVERLCGSRKHTENDK
ncbi:MAG: hypothetical protein HUK08_07205 [Bacteroidaceae bacterium]|nr:hypothetical protein [Bacteroidaceae bacterium]